MSVASISCSFMLPKNGIRWHLASDCLVYSEPLLRSAFLLLGSALRSSWFSHASQTDAKRALDLPLPKPPAVIFLSTLAAWASASGRLLNHFSGRLPL